MGLHAVVTNNTQANVGQADATKPIPAAPIGSDGKAVDGTPALTMPKTIESA